MTTPISVIATSGGPADVFLPPTGVIARGAGRVYRFYQADIGRGYSFSDIDGEALVECRCFDDEPAARRWVAADIALRSAHVQGVQ